MNVSLTPELERRIAEKVESGLYTTASEVVREGLRMLFAQDRKRAELIAELNAEIDKGMADYDRGAYVSGEEAKRELRAHLDSLTQRG